MEEIQDLKKLLIRRKITTSEGVWGIIKHIEVDHDGFLCYFTGSSGPDFFFSKEFADRYFKENSVYYIDNTPVLLILEETRSTFGFYVLLEPI